MNDYTCTVEKKGNENLTNNNTEPQHLKLSCGEHSAYRSTYLIEIFH